MIATASWPGSARAGAATRGAAAAAAPAVADAPAASSGAAAAAAAAPALTGCAASSSSSSTAPPPVPMAAPSGSAAAAAVRQALPVGPLPTALTSSRSQPQTMFSAPLPDGWLRSEWVVDARKLDGSDQQVVSPAILFRMSNGTQFRFKMVLNPKKIVSGRRVSCFKKAMGRGYITLKCEGDTDGGMGCAPVEVSFQLCVGSSAQTLLPPFRGTSSHDFAKRAVCGLPPEQEEWDFRSVVDGNSQTFVVCLLLAEARPTAGALPS